MLAINAPGAESFIPSPSETKQEDRTRNRFLYGDQMLWSCSVGWPAGSKLLSTSMECLDGTEEWELLIATFGGSVGRGNISRSGVGSWPRGCPSKGDFGDKCKGGGIGVAASEDSIVIIELMFAGCIKKKSSFELNEGIGGENRD